MSRLKRLPARYKENDNGNTCLHTDLATSELIFNPLMAPCAN